MTNVCLFRLDDITPDMDWNKFYRVKAIFDKYKVKPLVGVVPDNGDPGLRRGEYHKDFWEYIASLEQSGWQVAQHGYRHVYETKHAGMLGLKKASEFAGLPYEVQYEKIREGKGEKSDGTFRGRNRHLFYVGDGPVAVQDLSGQICIFVSRRDPGRTVYFGHPVSA